MKEPRIKVWVARDKDGFLNMFLCKPTRGDEMWFGHGEYPLDKESFSYIDWASEPIHVTMKLIQDENEDEEI